MRLLKGKGFSRKKKGKKSHTQCVLIAVSLNKSVTLKILGICPKLCSVQFFINCQAKRIDQYMISAVILKTVPFIHVYLLPLNSNCLHVFY